MYCKRIGEKNTNGVIWLHQELEKKTSFEKLITRLKAARDEAQDPDFKIIWAAKIQQLKKENKK